MKRRFLLMTATLLPFAGAAPLLMNVSWVQAPAVERPGPDAATPSAGVPGECVIPVSQRPQEMGCYLITETNVGPLRDRVYWHIFGYATPRNAQAAKGAGDTIAMAKRQALVLVLHDSRLPWTTMMRDAPNLPADCDGSSANRATFSAALASSRSHREVHPDCFQP
jgi:hypothetical protein